MAKAPAVRRQPAWLFPVLIWGTIVIAAIALGLYAEVPHPPPGASGPTFPRLPGPPPSVPILLFMLGVGSFVWYAVAVALPLLVWGARRVDTERHGIARAIWISTVVIISAIAVTTVIQYFLVYNDDRFRPGFFAYMPEGIRQSLLPWIAVVALVSVIEARRRAVQSRVESERLRAQIAEQRLVALTGQLHPHFLFNTLQGISTLIHRDPQAADDMLAKLSDLLRDVLRHRDQPFVRLADELGYTRTYLEIARMRFADRLDFTIEMSPGLEDAAVPLFILQPLVENALGHGIGASALGGRVTVRAHRDGDRLLLEVEDDGAGISSTPKEGIGLSNTRERLRASFSSDQSLTLESAKGGGAVVRVNIPYQSARSSTTA
jgi:signal transduction histidine kinase